MRKLPKDFNFDDFLWGLMVGVFAGLIFGYGALPCL